MSSFELLIKNPGLFECDKLFNEALYLMFLELQEYKDEQDRKLNKIIFEKLEEQKKRRYEIAKSIAPGVKYEDFEEEEQYF